MVWFVFSKPIISVPDNVVQCDKLGSTLKVDGNPNATSFQGLEKLTSVGVLNIRFMHLSNFNGLQNLTP